MGVELGRCREQDLLTIGDVVALLRDSPAEVTHSGLRFLEREGLVTPLRTSGGHRLYRASDIDRILRIKRWQQDRRSLEEIRARFVREQAAEPLSAVANRFFAEVVSGNPEAQQIVLAVDELGVPLSEVFESVIGKVQREVGDLWCRGELQVGQEHEVTEVVRDLIAELGRRHAFSKRSGAPIVAACVPGELHDIGLRMVISLLRAHGRVVHFLGASVEVPFLLEETIRRQPALVLLSASMNERLPQLRETVRAVREADLGDRRTLLVGGAGVADHEDELIELGAVPMTDRELSEVTAAALAASSGPGLADNAA